jgi:hypothetical protein
MKPKRAAIVFLKRGKKLKIKELQLFLKPM